MKYYRAVKLKDGADCIIRSASEEDAEALLEVFNRTHEETDFLLSLPGENGFTREQEAEYLDQREKGEREAELLAFVDGKLVGSAGFYPVSTREKARHRADLGISILRAYWRRGIGNSLLESCIECAKAAGFEQIELEAVSENRGALSLYRKLGFIEYGRNPKGFHSSKSGWQELVLMRLELKEA